MVERASVLNAHVISQKRVAPSPSPSPPSSASALSAPPSSLAAAAAASSPSAQQGGGDVFSLDVEVLLSAPPGGDAGTVYADVALPGGRHVTARGDAILPPASDLLSRPGREFAARLTLDVPVDAVELWWPVGYGAQPLYNLTVAFKPKGDDCGGGGGDDDDDASFFQGAAPAPPGADASLAESSTDPLLRAAALSKLPYPAGGACTAARRRVGFRTIELVEAPAKQAAAGDLRASWTSPLDASKWPAWYRADENWATIDGQWQYLGESPVFWGPSQPTFGGYDFTWPPPGLTTPPTVADPSAPGGRRVAKASDGDGEAFYFRVNGVPVYSKGSNVIPLSVLPVNVTAAIITRTLDMAAATHQNTMVRRAGAVAASWPSVVLLLLFAPSSFRSADTFLPSLKQKNKHEKNKTRNGRDDAKNSTNTKQQRQHTKMNTTARVGRRLLHARLLPRRARRARHARLAGEWLSGGGDRRLPASFSPSSPNTTTSAHPHEITPTTTHALKETPFACNTYPASMPNFLENVRQEVRQAVRRLGSHASTALFGGNNEVEASLSWYTNTRANAPLYVSEYNELFIRTIGGVMKELAPATTYLDSSPSSGLAQRPSPGSSATGDEGTLAVKRWAQPQDPRFGDIHFYNYEMDCEDWRSFPNTKFVSEFGWQSPPTLDTFAEATDRALGDWAFGDFAATNNTMLEFRQRHQNGLNEILAQIKKHYRVPARWSVEGDEPASLRLLQSYFWLSSAQQAACYSTGLGAWRRMRSEPSSLTMGVLCEFCGFFVVFFAARSLSLSRALSLSPARSLSLPRARSLSRALSLSPPPSCSRADALCLALSPSSPPPKNHIQKKLIPNTPWKNPKKTQQPQTGSSTTSGPATLGPATTGAAAGSRSTTPSSASSPPWWRRWLPTRKRARSRCFT